MPYTGWPPAAGTSASAQVAIASPTASRSARTRAPTWRSTTLASRSVSTAITSCSVSLAPTAYPAPALSDSSTGRRPPADARVSPSTTSPASISSDVMPETVGRPRPVARAMSVRDSAWWVRTALSTSAWLISRMSCLLPVRIDCIASAPRVGILGREIVQFCTILLVEIVGGRGEGVGEVGEEREEGWRGAGGEGHRDLVPGHRAGHEARTAQLAARPRRDPRPPRQGHVHARRALVAHRRHQHRLAELVLQRVIPDRRVGRPAEAERPHHRHPLAHAHVGLGAEVRLQPLAQHGEPPVQRECPLVTALFGDVPRGAVAPWAPAPGVGQVAGELAVVLHDRAQRRHRCGTHIQLDRRQLP